MAKKVLYNEEARAALLRGVDQLANAVKITLDRKAATSFWTRSSALRTSSTTVYPLPAKSN